MSAVLTAFLAVLSFASGAKAYEYGAPGLVTGALVVRCIYAALYLGLVGLSIPAVILARGHRLPYVPILIAIGLTFLSILAQIVRDFLNADVDPFDAISGDAFVATGAISLLFYYWSLAFVFLGFALLFKVRADNVLKSSGSQKKGLSPIFLIAIFAVFVVVFVFATASAGVYIDYLKMIYGEEFVTEREINNKADLVNNLGYTFSAVWYASAILLGVLGFFALKSVQRAGANDKVIKILLFVAFPIHILHVLEDLAFVVVWSPSGLQFTAEYIEDIYTAELAEVILYLGLHGATIAVIIFLGLRRSNWMLGAATTTWQTGQYAGYTAYTMPSGTQGAYTAQTTYPVQTTYPTQTTYPAQTAYPPAQTAYAGQTPYVAQPISVPQASYPTQNQEGKS